MVVAAEVRGNNIGRIRLKNIAAPSQKTLEAFVHEAVAPGSEVITDGWSGYAELSRKGFVHLPTVINRQGDDIFDHVLPRVHRVAALLKRWLLGIHQGRVSREQVDHYLDEFTFRFNRRNSPYRGGLFRRLLEQAVLIKRTPYSQLKARAHRGIA